MTLTQRAQKLVGGLRNVQVVFINHQDPDVAYNAGYLQKMNPNLYVLCSEDTWRLIRFFGLKKDRYKAVEHFTDMKVSLQTGHVLSFIPSPFCHFRGAVMMYDHETRILFTGDLFGGLSYKPDLYADESYWEGLKAFHQIYMPTQDAIRLAVKNIRALDPAPLIIAPQHGSIIAGDFVKAYLDKIETLPVGLNLLLESQNKENFIAAMNEMLLELSAVLGAPRVSQSMRVFMNDGSFPNVLHATAQGVADIKIDPDTAIDIFVSQILAQNRDQASVAEVAIVKVLLGRNITVPESLIRAGQEAPEFFEA
jgi:glyoxylase-like metal-dependent hydrolase (beta-lactamase superfamily II)